MQSKLAGPWLLMSRSFDFRLLPQRFSVCRLAPDEAIPGWACAGGFLTITRSGDELSIICDERNVPDGIQQQPGWRCIQLRGPFAFDEIGVLASFANPLAAAGVGILAISTFDTDFILFAEKNLESALRALTTAGHRQIPAT